MLNIFIKFSVLGSVFWVFVGMCIIVVINVVIFSSRLVVIKLGISGVKMVVNLVRNCCTLEVCLVFNWCLFWVVIFVVFCIGVFFSSLFIVFVVWCVLLGLKMICIWLLVKMMFFMFFSVLILGLISELLCIFRCRCVI